MRLTLYWLEGVNSTALPCHCNGPNMKRVQPTYYKHSPPTVVGSVLLGLNFIGSGQFTEDSAEMATFR